MINRSTASDLCAQPLMPWKISRAVPSGIELYAANERFPTGDRFFRRWWRHYEQPQWASPPRIYIQLMIVWRRVAWLLVINKDESAARLVTSTLSDKIGINTGWRISRHCKTTNLCFYLKNVSLNGNNNDTVDDTLWSVRKCRTYCRIFGKPVARSRAFGRYFLI